MNRLQHLKEFQEVLGHYAISDPSQKILEASKFVLLASPTGVGRNTLIRQLVTSGEYYFIVSDTTRQPRVNNGITEENGKEYWFIDENKFLADLRAGKYLEAAIIHNQQVSGVSIRELEHANQAKKIAITDIEVKGVATIKAANPNAIALFILPPSFQEWLTRIEGRGQIEVSEYRRRIQSAHDEYGVALAHDYYTYVINDQVERAASRINNLAKGKRPSEENQAEARKLLTDLYHQTKELLKKLD